jgi:DnaJ-class molecular chaperone
MRRACRDGRLSRWPLWQSRRAFQVIQRGHDKPQESLYDKLGFAKDDEARRVRRSVPELQQGLIRQVERLADPENNPKDSQRLKELREAYTLLHDDNFRANYGSHYYASNDARLHVLCDGGQVAANFNPEHQQFTYIDHAIDRDGRVSSGGSLEGQSSSTGSGSSSSVSSSGGGETPTAEALRDAFRTATGSSGATATTARAFNAAESVGPVNGSDLTHLLRITLEQSLFGCEVAVELRKNVRCTTCRGTGRQRLSKPRKCPQCRGRGSTHMPSATYHIERRCLYCGGEGTVPAPPCKSCEGRGVAVDVPVQTVVQVPAGTRTNSLFRVQHGGHDGVRGGHAGDLHVTVMVKEHRYFYRDGEKPGELHAMLPLPLSVALLGGRVEVPTLNGRGTLHVPPCVRNGQLLPYDVYGVQQSSTSPLSEALPQPSRLFFHALVMVPRVGELSGRQRQALSTYEQNHAAPTSTTSAAASMTEVNGTEEVADVKATYTATEPTTPQPASRDELMAQCAALKALYRHWFSSS